MKRNVLTGIIALCVIGLLFILTSVNPSSPGKANRDTAVKVNLALREIADQLLKQEQDFRSPVPPVRREGANRYLIALNAPVDYSGLRSLVDAILLRHDIRPDYRLSVLDCKTGEVRLGFLARAEETGQPVPCQDREAVAGCYQLSLTFPESGSQIIAGSGSNGPGMAPWLLIGLALGFPAAWLFWREHAKEGQEDHTGWMSQGQHTRFHPGNQVLRIKDRTLDLTFREAKLLAYFFDHAGQVLERERILQAVWEDEGVLVGRSLDVFVSRLRKKLKADPGLQIVSVHGVGYRLMNS